MVKIWTRPEDRHVLVPCCDNKLNLKASYEVFATLKDAEEARAISSEQDTWMILPLTDYVEPKRESGKSIAAGMAVQLFMEALFYVPLMCCM